MKRKRGRMAGSISAPRRGSGRRALSLLCGLALLIAAPWGAGAQVLAAPEPQMAAPQAAQAPIQTRTAPTADSEIADRIRGIFSEIDSLRGVQVRASAGVVTLSGTAPDAAERAKAEAIASRVAGVVTVENQVERDLQVQTNLSPALGELGEDMRGLLRALPLVGVALLIAISIGLIGHAVASLDRLWRWVSPNVFLAELIATFIRFAFIIVGLVAGLELLGATALLGAVLGGAGVIGIALGFAVRDTVDNYVSSLMLSLRQPFRANDHVVIADQEGRVVRLTSRATILMTLDGNHLRIPNSTVFKAVILNFTRNPERRFQFDLGIGADDEPLKGMAVGLAALKGLDFVCDNPEATAIIENVGDSNIVLRFFGWVDQRRTDFLKGRSLALRATKVALEDAGFALPEPIYRLRFDEAPSLPTGVGGGKAGPKAKRPHETAPPTAADTEPDPHVARMVREERAGQGDTDLLDDNKPVE